MPIDLEPSRPEEDNVIFVVESDEVIRSALHFILDDQNETYSFATPSQAFAKATGVTPRLVLLGIEGLQGNGERALAEISMQFPAAKILIVANSIHDPLALEGLKWGAHDVLGKPITYDAVRCKVDALLGQHRISPILLGLLPLSAAW